MNNNSAPIQSQQTKKILIVEDDSSLRNLYSTLLKQAGYQVEEAMDGQEGFLDMKNGGYNLILLDILLPKMNGLDILRNLKNLPPKQPNGIIIILTNLGENDQIAEGISLGAKDYLIKSDYTPKQVLEKVNNYLNISQSQSPHPVSQTVGQPL